METRALSVLVIDDDPDSLIAARLWLRPTGWQVATALSADEGLKLVSTLQPDVIVCDATMPRISGRDVIDLLKGDPSTAAIPVVLMTGFPNPETFADVRWTKFLSKPFGPAELRAAIENAAGTILPHP
jgi:CheY-like chemotaxis protein